MQKMDPWLFRRLSVGGDVDVDGKAEDEEMGRRIFKTKMTR
jgi:hypothetical protein